MNTNEKNLNNKIATWLGLTAYHYKNENGELLFGYHNNKIDIKNPDFLHDRNQQKWIEDKLIELGYGIDYYFSESRKIWVVSIDSFESDYSDAEITNQSKDLAFIDAVIELIDKNE